MKELIKKQHEECRKAYESLEDKISAAALQLLGAMGAYEKLCPELKENNDERIFAELISLFEDGIKGISHSYTGEDCGRWLSWLKEQGGQKTFLSEDDEKMIKNIIETINLSIEDCDVDDVGTKARFALEKERDWLKTKFESLKPQNRWKPTAAQMYALKQEVENKIYSGGDIDLNSLYHDLTKLL